MRILIKDLQGGTIHEYGDKHDALVISDDGRSLHYENLQNGDGSTVGDYRFVTENGLIPSEDKEAYIYGAEYVNIGGFKERTISSKR